MKTSVNQQKLTDLRNELNNIDKKIIKLLEKRLKVAEEVADVKNILQLPLTDQKREAEIINRLKKTTKDIILKETIANLYKDIFELSKTVRVINNQNQLPFAKIGIIGLGVIGGSVAKALKSKNQNLKIYTLKRNSVNNRQAIKEKIIDQELENLQELINKTELIILASSINSIIPLAQDIKKININKKIIVIDVASVKSKISQQFAALTDYKTEYLPTHPMAGSEKIGFAGSISTLFINQPWIITPHSKNTENGVEKISKLIKYLGSVPRIIDAQKHDEYVAVISHLIFLISTYLFAYSYDLDPKILEFAGTGFQSITRLASGSPIMHDQILEENYQNIRHTLNDFLNFINKNQISQKNNLKFFEENKKNRDKLYKKILNSKH